ncbi:hypothetical protein IJJ97_04405 [bacterium]|nr:hypothetical protein [bacterium]
MVIVIGGFGWLRSPDPDNSDFVFSVDSYGCIQCYNRVHNIDLVRPALWIKL